MANENGTPPEKAETPHERACKIFEKTNQEKE